MARCGEDRAIPTFILEPCTRATSTESRSAHFETAIRPPSRRCSSGSARAPRAPLVARSHASRKASFAFARVDAEHHVLVGYVDDDPEPLASPERAQRARGRDRVRSRRRVPRSRNWTTLTRARRRRASCRRDGVVATVCGTTRPSTAIARIAESLQVRWRAVSASSSPDCPDCASGTVSTGRGHAEVVARGGTPADRVDEGAGAERQPALLRGQGTDARGYLVMICEEARCPNIGECWGRGTARSRSSVTCTRACRYCYVHSEARRAADPARTASARPGRAPDGPLARRRRRRSIATTSRPQAAHYAATIRALQRSCPVPRRDLTPDFLGAEEAALATVLEARPDVFGHNIETVGRLHARMRGAKASYEKALWLLQRVKELATYRVMTKPDHRRPR